MNDDDDDDNNDNDGGGVDGDDNDNNNSVQFNSIQLFIISALHQQPEGQLQMQHKRRQNNNQIIKKLHDCRES
jgi:hypothetical protein